MIRAPRMRMPALRGPAGWLLRWQPRVPADKDLVVIVGACLAVLLGLWLGEARTELVTLVAVLFAAGVALLVEPRVVVFLGGVFLLIPNVGVAGIPGNEVGAALAIVGALVMSWHQFRLQPIMAALGGLLIAWSVAEQFLHPMGEGGNRRLLHIVLWVGIALIAASPGFPQRVLALGIMVGVALSLPAGLLIDTHYGDRLVGFNGDPNMYASTVAILAAVVVQSTRTRTTRILVWIAAGAVVVGAQSRTGMVALTVAVCVYYLLPILRAGVLVFPAAAGSLLWLAPAQLRTVGGFEEREGSDELRADIRQAGADIVRESPFTGHGLGTRQVDLGRIDGSKEGVFFFFHNSYYAMVAEVGLVGLSTWLGLVGGALWVGIRRAAAPAGVAAVAAGLTMGTQLGEVLLDLPMAIAIGLAWAPATSGLATQHAMVVTSNASARVGGARSSNAAAGGSHPLYSPSGTV